MNTLIIILELDLLGQLMRVHLNEYFNGYNTRAKVSENAWIIKTHKNTITVRDEIKNVINSSKFLVIDVTRDAWASANLPPDVTSWLKYNL